MSASSRIDRPAPVPESSRREDGWLLAAGALRHAALDDPGVAELSSSARFQTRGHGPAVSGIALTSHPENGVRADVGLVLALAATDRLDAVLRTIEQRMRAAWARLAGDTLLDLHLHVVDAALAEDALL